MSLFLIVLHVIVCFVLILVILLQAGRGQGLASQSFGSGNVQSLFGTRAGDFLTKATSASAICFLLTCIALGYMETQKSKSLLDRTRVTAPMNVDAIKKALEKVKKDSAAKTDVTEKTVTTENAATAKAAVTTQAAAVTDQGANTVPAAPKTSEVPVPAPTQAAGTAEKTPAKT